LQETALHADCGFATLHPFTLLETYDVELVLPNCTFADEKD